MVIAQDAENVVSNRFMMNPTNLQFWRHLCRKYRLQVMRIGPFQPGSCFFQIRWFYTLWFLVLNTTQTIRYQRTRLLKEMKEEEWEVREVFENWVSYISRIAHIIHPFICLVKHRKKSFFDVMQHISLSTLYRFKQSSFMQPKKTHCIWCLSRDLFELWIIMVLIIAIKGCEALLRFYFRIFW